MPQVVTVKATIAIPRVPNFLMMGEDQKISIADITDEGLRDIGGQWTLNLIERANQIRHGRLLDESIHPNKEAASDPA